MTYQKPVRGIAESSDFGDSITYRIDCTCGSEDDTLYMNIEVEDGFTQACVHIWSTAKTEWWKETFPKRHDIDNEFLQELDWLWKGFVNGFCQRVRQTYNIWVRGYLTYHGHTYLHRDQAMNLAEVLTTCIPTVEKNHTHVEMLNIRLEKYKSIISELKDENAKLKWAATEHD